MRLVALGCALATVTPFAVLPAVAEESEGGLAKDALNPVAALISLPLRYDYNSNIGPSQQGNQSVLTVQPVLPFSIGADWNLISRTIIQGVSLDKGVPGAGTPDGLGDVATGSGTQEGLGDTAVLFLAQEAYRRGLDLGRGTTGPGAHRGQQIDRREMGTWPDRRRAQAG